MNYKYLLFPVVCLVLLSTISCDNSEPEAEPEPEPYLTISAGAEGTVERWFIVTNGNGEIVGYTKVTKSGGEFELAERVAALNTYMNLHIVEIHNLINLNEKSFSVRSYLGVIPGQRWTSQGDGESVVGSGRITIEGTPVNSDTRLSPGIRNHATRRDESSTVVEFNLAGTRPEYVLSVYDPVNPMYKIISITPGEDVVYNYPNDFLTYDRVIEVETGNAHWEDGDFLFGGTQGYRKGQWSQHSSFSIFGHSFHSAVKFCYINNYDYYYTYYQYFTDKPKKEYYKTGTIPADPEIHGPEPNMTVTNSGISSFQAIVSDDIDLRVSGYGFSEKKGEVTNFYGLSIISSINGRTDFDLIFPEEFIAEVGELSFEDSQYNSTSFIDFKSDKPYDDWINWNFNRWNPVVEGEFFTYHLYK